MDLFLWLIDIELIIINDERPQCSCSMLEGQVLEHALMLGKIEVLSLALATEHQMLEHCSSLIITVV